MIVEASSETLVGEAFVGDEEEVTAISLFNIDTVQLIPETFYHNYLELISAGVDEELRRPTRVPAL